MPEQRNVRLFRNAANRRFAFPSGRVSTGKGLSKKGQLVSLDFLRPADRAHMLECKRGRAWGPRNSSPLDHV